MWEIEAGVVWTGGGKRNGFHDLFFYNCEFRSQVIDVILGANQIEGMDEECLGHLKWIFFRPNSSA